MLASLSQIGRAIYSLSFGMRDAQSEPGRIFLEWEQTPGYAQSVLKDYAISPQRSVEIEKYRVRSPVDGEFHSMTADKLIEQIASLQGSLGNWDSTPRVADSRKLLKISEQDEATADQLALGIVVPKVAAEL
jgi:hypothetical protein